MADYNEVCRVEPLDEILTLVADEVDHGFSKSLPALLMLQPFSGRPGAAVIANPSRDHR